MIITNVFEKKYENNVKCFWKRVLLRDNRLSFCLLTILLGLQYLLFLIAQNCELSARRNL